MKNFQTLSEQIGTVLDLTEKDFKNIEVVRETLLEKVDEIAESITNSVSKDKEVEQILKKNRVSSEKCKAAFKIYLKTLLNAKSLDMKTIQEFSWIGMKHAKAGVHERLLLCVAGRVLEEILKRIETYDCEIKKSIMKLGWASAIIIIYSYELILMKL
jgi:hypothetical protein